ncbi:hypothetical protein CONLIGDRAFT_104829 [Coniochaeta ligniaria NRRL 30616]|uniref:polynucleotide adenylyltransferase n=1 Tax=Coniochaeta ligniaria NRRL 30616 TaxID=1408157 RepID=A0A1J7JAY3_9PEZI|nr:hypothetical protein CONLIGDRAFT_104829 [Coniochaeta ligniaria NRRL 30616]
MSQGSRYPPYGGDGRRDYDSYAGRRDNNRDRDRDRDRDRNGRDRHNDRRASPPRGSGGSSGGGGDSYRPPSYSHRDNYYNSQDTRRNASGFDSWAPGTNGFNPPPPSYSQPPPPVSLPRDAPRPPQGDFSFRVEKPAGVQESYDSYRPNTGSGQQFGQNGSLQLPARPPGGSYQSNYKGHPSNRRGRGRGGRGGGFVRFKAADRPMLNPLHNAGPEQFFFDAEAGATYRPLSDLSDSDEAEMDISEGEGDATASQEPSSKRARLGLQKSASDDSVPKWSNPDPYTALPPPDAAGKQRKDVVQLIRKARVVEAKESKASIPAEAADFIPCDFDDSDDENDSEVEVIDVRPVHREPVRREKGPGVPSAPTGPRSVRRPSQQSLDPAKAPGPDLTDSARPTPANLSSLPPQPVQQNHQSNQLVPNTQPAPGRSSEDALGSRKRTHDDVIKLPAHAKLKKATKMPVQGRLVREWNIVKGEDPSPWLVTDHSESTNIGNWLHKEIVDFYDHIKPQDFEERIRGQLVEQLKVLCRAHYRDAEVYPFGSFPSGLYLPTGDMDLVLCSDGVFDGDRAKYNSKRALWAFRDMLVHSGLAEYPMTIEVIQGARVPLVKFIENRTGLKVDVSFENLTGINAIKTFLAWKEQYPAMPVLVTLVKHFLAMRGLNEPVNGGIGGFSVICLVVSMLQHMPDIQSRSQNGEHYYGDLLMAFFDLYGNKFNYQTTAISLNPPAYVPKNLVSSFTYKSTDRLSIIDPNNSSNDISGGSANFVTICALFAEAHRDLCKRMADLAKADKTAKRGASILEVLFAGNYSTFRLQREHLAKLAERGLGPQPVARKAAKRSPW